MPVEILVPPLSQTMDTLRLVEWLKKPGDPVVKGESLYSVETDKATLEIESPASGTLYRLDAVPGTDVKVLSSIGQILEAGETPPSVETPASLSTHDSAAPAAGSPSLPAVPQPGENKQGRSLQPQRVDRIFASPRARHLAEQAGIALDELRGGASGPGQVIISADVRAYLEQNNPQPKKVTPLARRMAREAGVDPSGIITAKPGTPINKADIQQSMEMGDSSGQEQPPLPDITRVSLSPTRSTIARRMRESLDSAAPVTYMSEVDATRLVRLRKNILEGLTEGEPRPSITDLLIHLVCRVLAFHPQLNATFDGETIEQYQRVGLALAVDTKRGLIVPVIPSAQDKSILELAQARTGLVEKALAGSLTINDLSGGTFTLSNLGTMGIDFFTPILNPPQVAILGVGRIRELPVARKGKIFTRRVMGLSLTCDHRVIDGAPAARFLQDLCRLVENPDLTWL